jgi:PEGA domain
MKYLAACGTLPLALAAASGAWCMTAIAAPDAAVAVLGVEASEGAPDSLATALTDAFRQRISGTKGFRLVAGRDLVEVKLVFSCPDEAPSCMAQAGKSLGASKLIFGSVKKSPNDNYVVTLKMLDTSRAVVDTFVAEQITKAQAGGAALRGPVQKWFATLTGQGGAGTIVVRGDVIGASVALDGSPWGLLGTEDMALSGVTPGKHELAVTKPGYENVRKEVAVASGETARVDVSLHRSPGSLPAVFTSPGSSAARRIDETARPDEREAAPRTALKTATWTVLGAGVVGVALGVKFGLNVQQINSDLNPFRRFTGGACMFQMCDLNNQSAEPRNAEQENFVKAKTADGKRLQTYQYISYGVGAALLVAGGYLLYRAYLEDDSERRTAAGPSVSLAPMIAPGHTGVAAQLTF